MDRSIPNLKLAEKAKTVGGSLSFICWDKNGYAQKHNYHVA
jgi:hypothetical protein